MNSEEPRKKSGKREAGWAVFITVTGILIWLIHLASEGKEVTAFVGLMTIAWPTAMTAVLGPHVLHHLKPNG